MIDFHNEKQDIKTMWLPRDDEVDSLSGWWEHFVNKDSEATSWEGKYPDQLVMATMGTGKKRVQGFPKHVLPVKHLFYRLIIETRETK